MSFFFSRIIVGAGRLDYSGVRRRHCGHRLYNAKSVVRPDPVYRLLSIVSFQDIDRVTKTWLSVVSRKPRLLVLLVSIAKVSMCSFHSAAPLGGALFPFRKSFAKLSQNFELAKFFETFF